jgi:hypothetical protein
VVLEVLCMQGMLIPCVNVHSVTKFIDRDANNHSKTPHSSREATIRIVNLASVLYYAMNYNLWVSSPNIDIIAIIASNLYS